MPEKISRRGYSYDDVLLIQQRSELDSRYDPRMDLSTLVARGAPRINVPLVSANMDTVTEAPMAIAMALYGGLGVIHRFMTTESQARQVQDVKAQMTLLENDPVTIDEHAQVSEALALLERRNRGYVLVTSQNHPDRFIGLATTRDFKFGDSGDLITKVMTPRDRILTVPPGTTREQAVAFMKEHRVEKVPVIDAAGRLLGIYSLKDDEYINQYPRAAKDELGRLLVGAAIGVRSNDLDRAHQLADAGADYLFLDIAHGALKLVERMIRQLKIIEGIKVPIVAGNVSTGDTVRYIYDSGADGVKLGVGAGFVCETRDVAGTGMPQITAVLEAREAMDQVSDPIPIMSDGGKRKPGDIPKDIGAGADSSMLGSYFAGAPETPGEVVTIDGQLKKMVRGMASSAARQVQQSLESAPQARRLAEGNTKFVPLKSPVAELLFQLEAGLRSGMSYTGALTILEMQRQALFVVVTPAGANEQRREFR